MFKDCYQLTNLNIIDKIDIKLDVELKDFNLNLDNTL